MRQVFAYFRDSKDRPLRDLCIRFDRIGLAVKDGAIYIPDSVTAKTNEDGYLSVELLETVGSEISTYWRCTIPGDTPFRFSLDEGAPVNLADLRTRGVDHGTAQTLLQMIQALQESLEDHIGRTRAHGVTGRIVGTTDPQVLDHKTIDCGTY